MSNELPAGAMIDDRHRVDGILGAGGFATVYLGTDTVSGRTVAIKMLNQALAGAARGRDRFDREIHAVSRLRDPHSVRLYTHGSLADGRRFIVFEHVPGEDLTTVLGRFGPLEVSTVEHIVRQLLSALREAHQLGVLHRDIKPANIRVHTAGSDPWAVKLLDFGIARLVDSQDARLTQTGELIGTPRYMSPEQLLSEEVGPPSDIYALGVVAVEMLVGSDAIHGGGFSDQLDRLQTHHLFATSGEHTPFHRVLERMTARAVGDRFAAVEEVLSALDNPERLPSTPPTTAPARMAPMAPQRPPASAVRPVREPIPDPDAGDPGSRIWLVGGLAVALVCGAGALLFALWKEAPAPPTRRTNPLLTVATPTRRTQSPPRQLPALEDEPDLSELSDDPCGLVPGWTGDRRFAVAVRHSVLTQRPDRHFHMHLPDSYRPDRRHPVVLLFQTTFHSPRWFLNDVGVSALADEHGFVVLSFEKDANDGGPFNRDDKDLVLAALESAGSHACLDPTRTYVMAHGTGGAFARVLACKTPIAGIATFGDWVQGGEPPCEPDPPVPMIRLAGLQDPYVPVAGGQNCIGSPILSLQNIETRFRERNVCGAKKTRFGAKKRHGNCWTWDCEAAPFVSCHIDGGHFLEDAPSETMDICAAAPPAYRVLETMWEFLSSQPPTAPSQK